MVSLLFTILLFAGCAYACAAGGRDGRWVAFLLIFAAVLSIPADRLDRAWSHTQVPVLIVDTALLVALMLIAFRSRRYWPIWTASFHFITVTTHAATIAEPDFRPMAYFAMQSFWSLPVILAMVGGIMLDRRAGLPKNAFTGQPPNERPDIAVADTRS